MCRCEIYDESDFAVALQELEARYDEIGDEPGACERVTRLGREAFARRDFSEARYAPDFIAVDHRPLGLPDADRTEYVERARGLIEASPDVAAFGCKSYFAKRAGILVGRLVGTSPEGSEYAWDLIRVVKTDEQDRCERIEYVPVDQWSEALALFDEWAAEPEAPEAGR